MLNSTSGSPAGTSVAAPRYIKVHARDNVAIVAADGGLPAGTRFPCALVLLERVPQGHKVALEDFAAGDPVRRYNVIIGRAAMLDVASGRKKTWAEQWRLHNALVLFNPAPVT